MLVVGGGIIGAGVALDAVTRGLTTGLLEQRDLSSGTSSRSSKLVHGGLRYLEMLDFGAGPRGAAGARPAAHPAGAAPGPAGAVPLPADTQHLGAARTSAPAWCSTTAWRWPASTTWACRGTGTCSAASVARIAPGPRSPTTMAGAIRYYDCQVDDARLVMTIARTAASHGAHVATRTKVVGFLREGERVVGVRARDLETGREFDVRARVVVNAAGVWTDEIQEMVGGRGSAPRPGHQGHPPGGAARPDPLRGRLHHPDREVGAVRDPVGPALDHRHHRHRLGPRQGPPGGVSRADIDYLLGAREHDPARAARPRGRRGRVRRAAAAAHRGVRADLAGSPASTPWSRRCPGLVMIAGGKLTTYRVMARDAVDAAVPDLGAPHRLGRPAEHHRPGAAGRRRRASRPAPTSGCMLARRSGLHGRRGSTTCSAGTAAWSTRCST